MCTLPSSPEEVGFAVRAMAKGIDIRASTPEELAKADKAALVATAVLNHQESIMDEKKEKDRPFGSMERPSNVERVHAQALAATAAGIVLAENVPSLAVDCNSLRDYLSWEDTRNVQGHKTIQRFLSRALGSPPDLKVVIGHHITYQLTEDSVPNEIPAADTLLFDHDLMHLVFGPVYKTIMVQLAVRVPELRERILSNHLDALDRAEGKTPPQNYDRVDTMKLMAAHLSDGRPNPTASDSRAE